MKFDLAVIGSGPGGYVAAIHAAQAGMRVICIEKESSLGGTCLNIGCIPSKALLHSTEYYNRIVHQGEEHGIEGALTVNLSKMMARKSKIVTGLTEGIGYLFKKNKIDWIKGEGKLLSAHEIGVGKERIDCDRILLATGSEPIPLPFLPFDERVVLSSTGALSLPKIPSKLLIVGAGIIGLELGSVYRRLGTEVIVIELLDRVNPTFDLEISKHLEQLLKKQGFVFHLATKVLSGKSEQEHLTLATDKGEFRGDCALIAIGRRPFTRGLGLEEIGVQLGQQGRVQINSSFQTSVANIYAIGDIVDGPMLAHKASEEGIAAVDAMLGQESVVNYLAIPNVMYTWPEVASVGISEEEGKESRLEMIIGKVPFKAIARARCSGDGEGMVKLIGEKRTGRLIGLHIIGPNASEMIHEGVLAIKQKLLVQHIADASHAHPTCSEAIKEAALVALGTPIHI